MRFVIDETSWCFDNLDRDACIEALETMLDQLDDAYAQGHSACYSEDLFSTPVWQGKCFYDLYEADSQIEIPWEVQERIASQFGRLSKWQDLPLPWPPVFEVELDQGAVEYAPSIAWAHEQRAQNKACAIACLVFPHGRSAGHLTVTVNGKEEPIWFVADHQNYCEFFRWLIMDITNNPSEMEALATSAFPSIDFSPGVFNGIKNMSKPYRELVKPLVLHLSVFSDHGKRIFSGPWAKVPAEFGALRIDISDENGNTKQNREARKERTVRIDGTDFIFWWHSKLEPDKDRIHICPDRIPNGGRLLVGIFCCHLKT